MTGIYELRVYRSHPGRFPELLARFRDHARTFFAEHGMVNLGYWVHDPDIRDPDAFTTGSGTVVYLLGHASRAAAESNWESFRADPRRRAIWDRSNSRGPLVIEWSSTWLTALPGFPSIPGSAKEISRA